MTIKWYGHSCFLMTTEKGLRILTDPCDESTGYRLSNIMADVVTISHDHFDHNYFAAVSGEPVCINQPGEYTVGEVNIAGFPVWHDDQKGALRGENIIYLYDVEGMRIAHLGDLGHMLEEDTLRAMGKVDVLLAPVGGTYTIDHTVACAIANATHTSVLIPMHYKTDALNMDLLGVQPLISAAKNCRIHRLNESECTLTKESLGEDRVLVLDYCK